MITIETNAEAAATDLAALATRIREQLPMLMDQLGRVMVKDVQDRIQSGDHNTWEKPSKWTAAKKGIGKALSGSEHFVFWRVEGMRLTIFGKTDGNWTLSQHNDGFENKLSEASEMVGERVRIKIVDPAPLGLPKPGDFSWVPKRAGATPPRKIWTTPEDAAKIAYPVAFRWLSKLTSETKGFRP